MKDLNGKVAVVTGASQGIGRDIALHLAKEGCIVAVLARTQSKLDEVVAQIEAAGGRASAHACDLSDAQKIPPVLTQIEERYGAIDILINNAGVGTFKPLEQMTAAEALAPVQLPFAAAIVAIHHVVPGMLKRGRGHIVNLTSPAGYFSLPYMLPYAAGRFAMSGLSFALYEEVAHRGIGVTLLCPAQVDTGYFDRNDADMGWYPRIQKLLPILKPERVGRETVRVIRKNKREHIFPFLLWFFVKFYMRMPRFTTAFLKLIGLWQPINKRPV